MSRVILAASIVSLLAGAAPISPPSMKDILSGSPKSDWRAIDPANTLVMELPAGRVVIELAPAFAPNSIANIETLVRKHYFDGSDIVRVQDNYVVQWSSTDDPPLPPHQLGAKDTIAPEFDRPLDRNLPFTKLPDRDTYAPEVGFTDGFAVARDPAHKREWLTHCYGMVGVGRDNDADSGSGAELYAVIGQSPRNLDRNVTLVGRVVQGMELLSVMPRGTGDLGFYEKPEQRIPIKTIHMGNDMPAAERPSLEALRTDSASFTRLIRERRNRKDVWYKNSPGHIGVCNMPLPVRAIAP
jgi:peptidylprolyl isomerase